MEGESPMVAMLVALAPLQLPSLSKQPGELADYYIT